MGENIFHFKRFSVRHGRSGLKVGTDGVILGACASLTSLENENIRILDVGTGTGLVALMLAQRIADAACLTDGGNSPEIKITGIDICADAINEAHENFEASPWANRLDAINVSLQNMDALTSDDVRYDLIVSNPPFFENSMKAPDEQRCAARHTDTLSYRDIIAFASRNMASGGSLAMILPASDEIPLTRYAASFGLFPSRILSVKTTASKVPKRILVELCHERAEISREELVLMADGQYTSQFRQLTSAFYIR